MEYRAARRAEPLVSGTYAMTRSFEPRRDPGTDFDGMVSELFCMYWVCATSEGGEVSCDPERWLRPLKPGGEVRLEEEKRFFRDANTEEKTGS